MGGTKNQTCWSCVGLRIHIHIKVYIFKKNSHLILIVTSLPGQFLDKIVQVSQYYYIEETVSTCVNGSHISSKINIAKNKGLKLI